MDFGAIEKLRIGRMRRFHWGSTCKFRHSTTLSVIPDFLDAVVVWMKNGKEFGMG